MGCALRPVDGGPVPGVFARLLVHHNPRSKAAAEAQHTVQIDGLKWHGPKWAEGAQDPCTCRGF